MTPAPQRRPQPGGSKIHAWALGLGTLLGLGVLGMAGQRPGDRYTALMAVVMVGAASASFVLAMLGRQPVRPRLVTVHGWIAMIAVGVLVVLKGPFGLS